MNSSVDMTLAVMDEECNVDGVVVVESVITVESFFPDSPSVSFQGKEGF